MREKNQIKLPRKKTLCLYVNDILLKFHPQILIKYYFLMLNDFSIPKIFLCNLMWHSNKKTKIKVVTKSKSTLLNLWTYQILKYIYQEPPFIGQLFYKSFSSSSSLSQLLHWWYNSQKYKNSCLIYQKLITQWKMF